MIEPSKFSAVAEKYEEENFQFRAFLKNRADADELDEQFLELHNELFADNDCSKCRNCCKEYGTTLKEEELKTIAEFLGLTKEEFVDKHLTQSTEGFVIEALCCFLKENGECEIEACKPTSCKEFPHTNKPERLWSLLGVIDFAQVCPVVFEILQRLKRIYGFRSRVR